MNSIEEEFNHYYLKQSNEYSEEEQYEDNNKEEEELEIEDKIINNEDNESLQGKERVKFVTSRRLRVLPKKYHIYTLAYKKKVIDEVNKYILYYYYIKIGEIIQR